MTTRTPAAIFEEVLELWENHETDRVLGNLPKPCTATQLQEQEDEMGRLVAQVRAYREEFRAAMHTAACTREVCGLCGRVSAVGFHVPDAIWRAVMGDSQAIACVGCFTRRADEKYVEWDRDIQFYPVSKRTHREALQEPLYRVESVTTSEGPEGPTLDVELVTEPERRDERAERLSERYTRDDGSSK